jgi:hypothetical protein
VLEHHLQGALMRGLDAIVMFRIFSNLRACKRLQTQPSSQGTNNDRLPVYHPKDILGLLDMTKTCVAFDRNWLLRHVAVATFCLLATVSTAAAPFVEQIKEAVEANVPPADVFGTLLDRDLLAYFLKTDRPNVTSVTFQLLRDTPAGPAQWGPLPNQRGTYPAYYLWVRVFSDSTLLDEGVVSAMAVERNRFTIRSFMPRAEIVRNPSQAGKIVPLNLVEAVHYLAEEENSSPGDSSANSSPPSTYDINAFIGAYRLVDAIKIALEENVKYQTEMGNLSAKQGACMMQLLQPEVGREKIAPAVQEAFKYQKEIRGATAFLSLPTGSKLVNYAVHSVRDHLRRYLRGMPAPEIGIPSGLTEQDIQAVKDFEKSPAGIAFTGFVRDSIPKLQKFDILTFAKGVCLQ